MRDAQTLLAILKDAQVTEMDIQKAMERARKDVATPDDWALIFAASALQLKRFETMSIGN
jgi:hypothetical protein